MALRRIGAAAVLLALISWNAWIAHTMVTRLQMGDFRILYLSARAQLEGRDMYDLPSEPRTQLAGTLRGTLVVGIAEVAFLLMLPLTLGWAAARQDHWKRAGGFLGLAMSLKLFPLIFIPDLSCCAAGREPQR